MICVPCELLCCRQRLRFLFCICSIDVFLPFLYIDEVSVDETITQLTLTPPYSHTSLQNGKRGHRVLKRDM